MEKKLYHYMTTGFFFTVLLGSFLYFAYEISSKNLLVGMFAPVSNSPWEYLKLIFFPSFLYFMCGWGYFARTLHTFIQACFSGLITGTFFFLIMFFTYTGIIGQSVFVLNLFAFLFSAYLVYYLSYNFIILHYDVIPLPLLVCLIVTLMVCFFSFSFSPPELPLFSIIN